MFSPVDFDENLVKVPAPMSKATHCGHSFPMDFFSENLAEAVPPELDRLMGNVDPALMKQVFDVSQRGDIGCTSSRPDG